MEFTIYIDKWWLNQKDGLFYSFLICHVFLMILSVFVFSRLYKITWEFICDDNQMLPPDKFAVLCGSILVPELLIAMHLVLGLIFVTCWLLLPKKKG